MKTYPEYFIGGPLDGQDKLTLCPDVPEWEAVRWMEEPGIETVAPIANDGYAWHYYCHKIRLGGVVLKYWYDGRILSRQIVALRFWELILKPHEIKVQLKKEAS